MEQDASHAPAVAHAGGPRRAIVLLGAAFLGLVPWSGHTDSTVVFNEIMYHPAGDEPGFEWIELHNQMSVDLDLSRWSLRGAVTFAFPLETVVPGGGFLVVASSPAELAQATGLTNLVGPFSGRLSNGGERLELRNNNDRLMDAVIYGVEGDWPVGADGAGPSLAKTSEDTASPDPANWRVSGQPGGTPGSRNFPDLEITTRTTQVIRLTSAWRYLSPDRAPEPDWSAGSFDDRAWNLGPGLFHAGLGASAPGQTEPISDLFSTGLDPDGEALLPGSPDPHYALTASAQGTPPPPPVPATVMSGHPAWLANDSGSVWIGPQSVGTANVSQGNYTFRAPFSLEGFDPTTVRITLQVAVDNELTQLLINGGPAGFSHSGFSGFSAPFTLATGFRPGLNHLDFVTLNASDSPNPAGFRVRIAGTAFRPFQTNTPLPPGTRTHYFRTVFAVDGDPQNTAFRLRPLVDDGAVFYLNGTEVLRWNLPAGQVTHTTAASTNVPTATLAFPVDVPTGALIPGLNVLAVEVHQAVDGVVDTLFGAEATLTLTNLPVARPPFALNEVASAGDAPFWIEILNHGTHRASTAGLVLSRLGETRREYRLPPETLESMGRLVLSEDDLGVRPIAGDRLVLYGPAKTSVLDAIVVRATALARWPEGTGPWLRPSQPSAGAANRVALEDTIVINEILYHPREAAAGDTWIELYNRGASPVALGGWRFARGIEFEFPEGTSLEPGGHLVVAQDATALRLRHPQAVILGNFTGDFARGGEAIVLTDALGNPADEVRYYDDRPWPAYADGDGSSLELRDPRADNASPEAWAASDEGARSAWQTYRYRGVASAERAASPTRWREFVLGLLGAGEVLIDDVSVLESPSGTARQLLQNGGFESGLNPWRLLGNHRQGQVVSDPSDPANHVLHLVTDGDTEHMHNHVEATLANNAAIVNGREYEISFRARWLGGCNQLNTRLYFNRLAHTTALQTPDSGGTPGTRNSRFAPNLGPTWMNLSHQPVLPLPTESVTVSVDAGDPDGIAAATLHYRANDGAWRETSMTVAGPATRLRLQASVPPHPAGNVVQFYVEARDAAGDLSTYPAGAAASRALYRVADGRPGSSRLHRLRLLMTPSDTRFLHASTNVMSNERLGCTVVYDEREVFYEAGVHLQGSERGRDESQRVGFTLRFPRDHRFRGVHDTITVDRSGGYSGRGGKHDEILLKHAIQRAGGLPGMYDDLVQLSAPRASEDGTGLLILAKYGEVFLDTQYPAGADGELYKLELIYYPTTTTDGSPQSPKLPQPDDVLGTDIQDLGNDPEAYRWVFLKENHAARNNYAPLMSLAKAFSLTGAALEARTTEVVDVDEWLRAVAFLSLIGAQDMYTYGLPHNLQIYFRPEDGKGMALLWDMDFAFVAPTTDPFPGSGSATTYRLVTSLRDNHRRYSNHLLDLSHVTGDRAYMSRWARHYAGLAGDNWDGVVDYLVQRATFVRSRMPLTTPFRVTSNGGEGFATAENSALLTGLAPLTVKDIDIGGVRYSLRWTSLTNWTLTVPLPAFTNLLVLQGLDNAGLPLTNAVAAFTVTNLNAPTLPTLIINEWMTANRGPDGFPDPADGRFQDWFELYNPNLTPVELSGLYLTDDLAVPAKWRIPEPTFIGGSSFLLVWADGDVAQNPAAGGTNVDLHAAFSLDNEGEAVGLFARDGRTLLAAVTCGPQADNVSQGCFPDGDTNAVQFFREWTPRAPNRAPPPEAPRFDTPTLTANGLLVLSFTAVPGRTYQLEQGDRLPSPDWQVLRTLTAEHSVVTVTQEIGSAAQRFYRVSLLP